MLEQKMEIIKELQRLKRAFNTRVIILESHLSSIKSVGMQDLDGTLESVEITLDRVLGDLDSGYAVNCKEIDESSAQIESIRKKLTDLWNGLS